MYILWTMVKLCLLMASNFGYWEAARRKWNMNVYLLPAVTIGAQFCVMFAAGLLNYLGEAAGVVISYQEAFSEWTDYVLSFKVARRYG